MTIDLEYLETLAKAATPGAWISMGEDVYSDVDAHVAYCPIVYSSADERCITREQAERDAAFIAAANPAAVLELIAELRQAWKERDWLAGQLNFEKCCAPSDLKDEPGYCLEHTCVECGLSSANAWLKVAKEVTCPKN